MRILILINVLVNVIFLQQASGKISNTIKCLAQEELIIHKAKTTGPVYHLNQRLINYFSTISAIDIKASYYPEMCNHPSFSPSVSLLRLLLLKGRIIFKFPKFREEDVAKKAVMDDSINGLINESPHIFFKFLAKLQGLTGRADCLGSKIPHLNYFLDRFKYLEEDYPISRLIEEKEKINEIFNSLKGFDRILSNCKPQKKNKDSASGKSAL